MDPLVWIGVGLGVGLLAPLLAGDGRGLFGDLLFGLLGAFVVGWIADLLIAGGPLDGLAGSTLTALLGAAAAVTALRLTPRARPRSA